MSVINPISIRLPAEQLLLYEAEAAARNMPLRTYLRQRLETGDNMLEEFSALRREVQYVTELLERDGSSSSRNGNEPGTHTNILIEILLLFRQIAQPQKVQLAQSELKRLGFEVWTSQKESNYKEE